MSEQQQVEPVDPQISAKLSSRRSPNNQQLKTMPASQVQDYMLRDLRNWGWGLVVLGAIHLFTSGVLNSAWGVLLIVVGLASFFFKDAAMFVVYSITLAWAAFSNLISSSPGWGIFSILQVVWTVQVFRRFQVYHKAQTNLKEPDPFNPVELTRAQRLFPVTALILGIIGLGGLVGLNIMAIVGGMMGLAVPDAVYFSIDLSLIMGILGLAIGLAAVLSDFPNRVQAIVGSVAGGLAMGLQLALILLVRFIL